jgi:hypothetical protein
MSRLFIRASLSWLIVVSMLLGARPVAVAADDGNGRLGCSSPGLPGGLGPV